MPAFVADNANIINNVGNLPDVRTHTLKWMERHYTLLGTEATNDTVDLGWLPPGACIVPQLSYVTSRTDPGTALLIDIGYSADADYFCDGLDAKAAGTVVFTTPAVPGQVSAPVTFTAATKIVAKLASVDTATAGAVIEFNIAYTELI